MPEIAAFLKQCLCDSLALHPNPPLECCLRLPGDVVMDMSLTEDFCCAGLAYVQVGDEWPSSVSFPEQDINRQATSRCAPPSWGVDLKFGVLRCVPSHGPLGPDQPPTCEQWTSAAIQQMTDSQALRQAACCFRSGFPTSNPQLDGMSIVIGRMSGGQAQGGCSDRYMTVQVQIPSVCDGC